MKLENLINKHNSPFFLRIKVIPGSPKNEITEIMEDETVKIRIKAAPERGKANKELIKFLSTELGVPKSSIEIISGKFDPLKLVQIKYGKK